MTTTTRYTVSVATTLVIANMVGTGVFTSLGYQVGPIPSSFAILLLWIIGGVVALCGALCYAELATRLQQSGGEYLFLGKILHPSLGFLSGWISLVVGFAGAVSAVALAIGAYAEEFTGLPEQLIAIICILAVSAVHLLGVRTGGITQNILTSIKILLILFFCLSPFFLTQSLSNPFAFESSELNLVWTPEWAVSLVFVMYAYSGWNASAYIAGNLDNPSRNIPRSLLLGTMVVLVIYVSLNAMFLAVASHAELKDQNDIGNVVAIKLLGEETGRLFSMVFSLALLSTLSAMTIAGPRVGEAMGVDYPKLRLLSVLNGSGMPWVAIAIQAAWAVLLVLVSSFKEIIQYISVSLSWFTFLTVLALMVLRRREGPRSGVFSTPWYPIPALIFLAATGWMVYYMTISEPKVIIYSIATITSGFGVYLLVRKPSIE